MCNLIFTPIHFAHDNTTKSLLFVYYHVFPSQKPFGNTRGCDVKEEK